MSLDTYVALLIFVCCTLGAIYMFFLPKTSMLLDLVLFSFIIISSVGSLALSKAILKERHYWKDAKRIFDANNVKIQFTATEWNAYVEFLKNRFVKNAYIVLSIWALCAIIIVFLGCKVSVPFIVPTALIFFVTTVFIHVGFCFIKLRRFKSFSPNVAVGMTGFSILNRFQPWFTKEFSKAGANFELISLGSIYVVHGSFSNMVTETYRDYFVPFPARYAESAISFVKQLNSRELNYHNIDGRELSKVLANIPVNAEVE